MCISRNGWSLSSVLSPAPSRCFQTQEGESFYRERIAFKYHEISVTEEFAALLVALWMPTLNLTILGHENTIRK